MLVPVFLGHAVLLDHSRVALFRGMSDLGHRAALLSALVGVGQRWRKGQVVNGTIGNGDFDIFWISRNAKTGQSAVTGATGVWSDIEE